ncbi:cupin [Lentzea sp. NBRC 105346]|nr:cupin [Lentzea sp. NBRC 105346]
MSYPEPVYLGENGEVTASFRPVTHEPELRTKSGVETHYLATGKSTNGHFGLYRWDTGPEPTGPKPHFHRAITESFFVISGTMRLYDGSKWIDGRAGDFLFVPEGGIHAFRNESGEPASMLILFTPGAPREGYFEGLAQIGLSGRKPSEEEMLDFYLRHDTFWT